MGLVQEKEIAATETKEVTVIEGPTKAHAHIDTANERHRPTMWKHPTKGTDTGYTHVELRELHG